jgi:pimeloyl-ACP methyl ester carboxylesterase
VGLALSLAVTPALADESALGGNGLLADIPPVPAQPVREFYQPPNALPKGALGTIIRSEELPSIPGATVRRIMYVSTDNQGKRVPVTGVVLTPTVAPRNPGPGGARPIVTHVPGTRGLADSCAPSNFYDRSTIEPRNIELLQAPGYLQQLAAGATVVITDYVGGGTPLAQEYLVARSEGQNGIDAARAALLLDPNDDLNASSPLVFFGVSQGGQAAAAVAELLPTYGRDLQPQVRGVAAGGVVTDTQEEIAFADGNPILAGVGLAMLTGLNAGFPKLDLNKYATERGRAMFERVRASCIGEEFVGFGATTYADVTKPDVTTLPDWRAALAQSKLGNVAPQVPTYLFNGSFDTIVPAHMTPQLFNDWCSRGATTEFTSYPGTEHVGSLVVAGIPAANRWILDRLAGKPVPAGCTHHAPFSLE